MKTQLILRGSILTLLCAGGLMLLAGCSTCGHCGERPDKKAKVEAPAPGPDHRPMHGEGMKARMGKGRPETAGPRGMGQEMRGEGGPFSVRFLLAPANAKELGLTDQQIEKIRSIEKQNAGQRSALQERQRDGQKKMRELMEADQPDEAAIMKQIDINGQAMIDMRKAQVGEMLEARKVLTPEQLQQARGLIRQRLGGVGPDARRPRPQADRPLRQRIHQRPNEAEPAAQAR